MRAFACFVKFQIDIFFFNKPGHFTILSKTRIKSSRPLPSSFRLLLSIKWFENQSQHDLHLAPSIRTALLSRPACNEATALSLYIVQIATFFMVVFASFAMISNIAIIILTEISLHAFLYCRGC